MTQPQRGFPNAVFPSRRRVVTLVPPTDSRRTSPGHKRAIDGAMEFSVINQYHDIRGR